MSEYCFCHPLFGTVLIPNKTYANGPMIGKMLVKKIQSSDVRASRGFRSRCKQTSSHKATWTIVP
ncbi:MAG: hypothetical protein BWX70_03411 [Verrucomicrobia bacterium ADurb.Bin070]|nr:MAG: hypothetical protein BWX70_03411 [Verrucomicrobia bacterium ADurb.Bin070]